MFQIPEDEDKKITSESLNRNIEDGPLPTESPEPDDFEDDLPF